MSLVTFLREPEAFSDETLALLTKRLKSAAIILAITLALAFAFSLRIHSAQWLLRTAVLTTLVACYLYLRDKPVVSLPAARLIEALVFLSVAVQITVMMGTLIVQYAEAGETASVVNLRVSSYYAWAVLILLYGLYMPNSWARAALILFPAACAPYLLDWLLQWQVASVDAAIAEDKVGLGVPITLVGALAATCAARITYQLRESAFQLREYGQYRLLDQLGGGGMGEIYKAQHKLLKRPCAIKLIKEDKLDRDSLDRFEREVQATATLSHWNTVEVYDYGRASDGTFYYVMELLQGLNLEELVQRYGPLSASRAIYFLRQACDALFEAHCQRIIHRDVKPANLFAAKVGGRHDVLKVLDFGLVRRMGVAGDRKGNVSGSPLYMPPEQVTAFDKVDARGDVYSLGAVAYFLVTGRPPFEGSSISAVLQKHAQEEVIAPSDHVSDLPEDFEAIVLRCLQKDPASRYQSILDLITELDNCRSATGWNHDDAARWWRERHK